MSRFGNWLSKMLNGKTFAEVNLGELNEILAETHVRELAYWSCVGMIARLVSKCDFQTLARGSPVKGDEWYAWNVAPNNNQNSTQFIAQIIHNLYRNERSVLLISHTNTAVDGAIAKVDKEIARRCEKAKKKRKITSRI